MRHPALNKTMRSSFSSHCRRHYLETAGKLVLRVKKKQLNLQNKIIRIGNEHKRRILQPPCFRQLLSNSVPSHLSAVCNIYSTPPVFDHTNSEGSSSFYEAMTDLGHHAAVTTDRFLFFAHKCCVYASFGRVLELAPKSGFLLLHLSSHGFIFTIWRGRSHRVWWGIAVGYLGLPAAPSTCHLSLNQKKSKHSALIHHNQGVSSQTAQHKPDPFMLLPFCPMNLSVDFR